MNHEESDGIYNRRCPPAPGGCLWWFSTYLGPPGSYTAVPVPVQLASLRNTFSVRYAMRTVSAGDPPLTIEWSPIEAPSATHCTLP